jgi:hypothetical protein
MARVSARAGIHGGDELEVGRQGEAATGAGNMHASLLQRLAESLQRVPPEFRELIEEEHPAVGEGDLTRGDGAPAAEEPGEARGVMGGPERPLADEAMGCTARGGPNRGGLDPLREVGDREEVNETPG